MATVRRARIHAKINVSSGAKRKAPIEDTAVEHSRPKSPVKAVQQAPLSVEAPSSPLKSPLPNESERITSPPPKRPPSTPHPPLRRPLSTPYPPQSTTPVPVHHRHAPSTSAVVVEQPRRRVFDGSEELDKSTFQMADLIYWNPDNDTRLKPRIRARKHTPSESDTKDTKVKLEMKREVKPDVKLLAPKVKVGEHGQLILDEKSTVIQHDAEEAARELETIYQEHTEHVGIVSKEHHISSASFRRHRGALGGAGAKNWSAEETDMFFNILQAVGTDFTLMSEYFNGRRTRGELKNKYKRELRLNKWRIDQVESNPIPLSRDVYQFVIDADAATNEKKIRQANERRERQRQRREEKMKKYDPEGYERRQKRRAANKEVKEKQASLGQQLSEHKKRASTLSSMGETVSITPAEIDEPVDVTTTDETEVLLTEMNTE